MLENSAIKFASVKLAGTTLLPGSMLLIGGIIIWRLWHNQAQLKTESSELKSELKRLKEQVNEHQAAFDESMQTDVSDSSSTSKTPKPDKMGLFEHLINENIQLRKQA